MNYRQILTAPNQLTLLRMIFLPFIVINLVKHDFKWALALFVLAGLSDTLDGLLARTLHQQTLLGQYLDPIADKLLMQGAGQQAIERIAQSRKNKQRRHAI